MGHPVHPAIPYFTNSKLYHEDLDVIGLKEIAIYMGKEKPTKKVWDVKRHARLRWEVIYDKYGDFEVGQIIKTGDVLKMINKGLYGKNFKTAWVKIQAVQYAGRDMRFPVNCEYVYQMIIKGKECFDFIAKTENRIISDIGDLIPRKQKKKTSDLYRIHPARRTIPKIISEMKNRN